MNSKKFFDNNMRKKDNIKKLKQLNVKHVIAQRRIYAPNLDIINNLTVGVSIVRYPERIIEYANKEFSNIFHIPSIENLINHHSRKFYTDKKTYLSVGVLAKKVLRDGYGRMKDVPYCLIDGEVIYIDISGKRFDGSKDGLLRIIWTYVDVTEKYILNETLEKQSLIDKLTGLPNRRALDKEIEKAMSRAIRHNKLLGVVMIDLDEFKSINDNYGHEVGDIVLQILAKRLNEAIRHTDFVSRLGGDEFVVLIEDCASMKDISVVLDKLGKTVHGPIELKNKILLNINLSAGLCLYPVPEKMNNSDVLIRYADQALYKSKEHKHDRLNFWTLYGEPISLKINHIQNLLEKDGLQIFYQPIMDSQSCKIVGVEALARIQDADGLILSPAQFLPYLYSHNLFDMSRRIFLQSAKDMSRLESFGFFLWVSINIDLSSLSISRMEHLKDTIDETTIDHSRIILEIIESKNVLEQKEMREQLRVLKSLGILLALDNVGKTKSSLLSLRDLPIDQIKLDQNFVRTLDEKPSGIVFTRTVFDIAETLGTTMVAKGVEKEDILDAMTILGIPLLQGYAIARPMPFEKLLAFLQKPAAKRQIHPNSLLGLYAKQVDYDKSLRKEIRINPQIVIDLDLGNAQNCPIHKDLMRLGITETDPIYRLHQKYHKVLHIIKKNMIGNKIGNEDWKKLEEIQQIFLKTISKKYSENRHEQTV